METSYNGRNSLFPARGMRGQAFPFYKELGRRREMSVSFLRGLFGQKQDPLLERVGNLVQAAHINAVGMFTPLLDRFLVLKEANVEHWDFVLTIAGVFMAATRLNNLRIGDVREKKLMEIIAKDIAERYPDGIQGFEDCKGLFESEFDRLTAAGHESNHDSLHQMRSVRGSYGTC